MSYYVYKKRYFRDPCHNFEVGYKIIEGNDTCHRKSINNHDIGGELVGWQTKCDNPNTIKILIFDIHYIQACVSISCYSVIGRVCMSLPFCFCPIMSRFLSGNQFHCSLFQHTYSSSYLPFLYTIYFSLIPFMFGASVSV